MCLSEGLLGAVVGACLTFLFTYLIELRKQHYGKTDVILLNTAEELNNDGGNKLKSILVDANVECTNTKLIPTSIYDWYAVIITDKGTYEVQMHNKKDDSYFDFMDVVYLNQNQSCLIPLHGEKVVDMEYFEQEPGIKDVTTINQIDIFYRCNGSKERKKAKRR